MVIKKEKTGYDDSDITLPCLTSTPHNLRVDLRVVASCCPAVQVGYRDSYLSWTGKEVNIPRTPNRLNHEKSQRLLRETLNELQDICRAALVRPWSGVAFGFWMFFCCRLKYNIHLYDYMYILYIYMSYMIIYVRINVFVCQCVYDMYTAHNVMSFNVIQCNVMYSNAINAMRCNVM